MRMAEFEYILLLTPKKLRLSAAEEGGSQTTICILYKLYFIGMSGIRSIVAR